MEGKGRGGIRSERDSAEGSEQERGRKRAMLNLPATVEGIQTPVHTVGKLARLFT